ncbi:hypothetical protein L6164_025711 [Bauhinia variegata]|uniref:Uncharacterized protein n=1 Tax=Bauhinia variegata TaxID=167791 RepID=A0ACB9M285_BAUVA|nr:hypothetical protein L6164_025711 [Bauhinia variegata]
MAFRGVRNLRLAVTQLEGTGNRSIVTSTIPKKKPMTSGVDAHAVHPPPGLKQAIMKAELAPVWIIFGMVGVAVTIAMHTGYQQLRRSPAVHLNKKKRESLQEVDNPDGTIACADKFINNSFLRKVAHIQDHHTTLDDPVHPNPFTRPRNAETLKSVGINPRRN